MLGGLCAFHESAVEAPNPKQAPIIKFQVPRFHEPSNRADWAQPFQGCGSSTPQSQGSLASSATLGFEAESRWDSWFEKVHGFNAHLASVDALHEPLQFERC